MTLARDASSAGDTILAESYYQHAEHYQRMINEFSTAADRTDEKIETPVEQDTSSNEDVKADTKTEKKPAAARGRAPRAKKPQTVDA